MFEQAKNTKKQGDCGLGIAIAWFSTHGYTVSIPLTDSQEYDLVVDNNETLFTVQVKTTSYTKYGIYTVSLTTKGGNRTSTGKIKKLNKDEVDLIFIVCSNNDMYLIPTWELLAGSSINLGKGYQKYKV